MWNLGCVVSARKGYPLNGSRQTRISERRDGASTKVPQLPKIVAGSGIVVKGGMVPPKIALLNDY
jgi:hypothetical protein